MSREIKTRETMKLRTQYKITLLVRSSPPVQKGESPYSNTEPC
jgi:hypothetical protein